MTKKVDLASGLIDELMDPKVREFSKKPREERAEEKKTSQKKS